MIRLKIPKRAVFAVVIAIIALIISVITFLFAVFRLSAITSGETAGQTDAELRFRKSLAETLRSNKAVQNIKSITGEFDVTGASRAIEVATISEAGELYGYQWIMRQFIGEYELSNLYVIEGRMMLGAYERAGFGDRIWAHASVTEGDMLSGIVYDEQVTVNDVALYYRNGAITVFGFDVYTTDGLIYSIACSAAFAVPNETVEQFISSVWTD